MRVKAVSLVFFLSAVMSPPAAGAADWPGWRGPWQNGASMETGLISHWSAEGKNLIWRADFCGRSTPVVLDGRVCVTGRGGEGITEQELVACFDAASGKLLWEHRFNVFHTTIPFNRVGWASPAGDPETGNIYVHGVGGLLLCLGPDGEVLWSRSLTEEFGRISGYGGRVHTPVVHEDLVIISFLNLGWGDQAVPRHRYFAFDKRSGAVVWVAAPGGRPLDTTYSTPVAAAIGGRRLLIGGNADGAIYAMAARTGEKVWGFRLSRRGINSSVLVEGSRVYAAHSEENVDNTAMGRVVCIDGGGTGDVTATHEIWRYDEFAVGYSSPAMGGGGLYVVDNGANMHCLDPDTGRVLWEYGLGTVGRGSPVWADGKLYATEVNGFFHIIDVRGGHPLKLDRDEIRTREGRPAEIFGSPALANGRIYFATEEGLYCLGDREAGSVAGPAVGPESPVEAAGEEGPAASLLVVPAEVVAQPRDTVRFEVLAFDHRGRPVEAPAVEWALEGLEGSIGADGSLVPNGSGSAQAGIVLAAAGGVEGRARVRVVPGLPWSEDFEEVEEGGNPAHWIGAGTKFKVRDVDGNKVLVKPPARVGLHRSNVYLGPPGMRGYAVQADLMGTWDKRRRPDMGLIANRYTLDMMGNHQQLQIRSWASDLRMAVTSPFDWEPDVWYTMKMEVEVEDDVAIVRGKVWPRNEEEPGEWTITARDPLPNREGSPGLYGYSPAEIHYDNVKVWAGD